MSFVASNALAAFPADASPSDYDPDVIKNHLHQRKSKSNETVPGVVDQSVLVVKPGMITDTAYRDVVDGDGGPTTDNES